MTILRPIIKFTVLFRQFALDCPFVYIVMSIILFGIIYFYMLLQTLCKPPDLGFSIRVGVNSK